MQLLADDHEIGYAAGMGHAAIDIENLTPAERLDLIERLWNSLREEDLELTDAEKAELDRRNDELNEDIAAGRPLGIPWDEVKSQLLSTKKGTR